MLQFDELGHLLPAGITVMTLDEFERQFVENLDDRLHRRQLFEGYLLFLEKLKKIIGPVFYQWVDGSFVSQKFRPADLDLVTFVGFDVYRAKNYELTWLKAKAKLDWNIDHNASMTCGPEHPDYLDALGFLYLWQNFFGRTRPVGNALPRPKGFVQINFDL